MDEIQFTDIETGENLLINTGFDSEAENEKSFDIEDLSNSSHDEIYNEIMSLCHKLFGGFASEGCCDFSAKYLDYGLYVCHTAINDVMADKIIPFWQIVYHGIILYNSTTDTVNYPIKDNKNHLTVVEDGSRPSFYFYSKFLKGSNQDDWLGKEDLVCDTDEQLRFGVSKIKEAYEEYKRLASLQTEFIESHKEVEKNVFEVLYSNGVTVKVDYNKNTYTIYNLPESV